MAELQREEERQEEQQSEESVKLFVGQVPKHMTESQLVEMFQEFAIVDEVNIIKDKTTRASRGSQIYVTHFLFSTSPPDFWIANVQLQQHVFITLTLRFVLSRCVIALL
uniref:RNA binding protein n=1 Tax=Solanum tuberosum TaxID=4113 RepID=M1BEJ6_SOLTU